MHLNLISICLRVDRVAEDVDEVVLPSRYWYQIIVDRYSIAVWIVGGSLHV